MLKKKKKMKHTSSKIKILLIFRFLLAFWKLIEKLI